MRIVFLCVVVASLPGCEAVQRDALNRVQKKESEREALIAEAKEAAEPLLKKHGIARWSDDAGVVQDNGYMLVGQALDVSGKMQLVGVEFDRATFGDKVHIKIKTINIDHKIVYEAE